MSTNRVCAVLNDTSVICATDLSTCNKTGVKLTNGALEEYTECYMFAALEEWTECYMIATSPVLHYRHFRRVAECCMVSA